MNNKKISILGGGESGVGAAMLAKKQGFDVFLSDAGELKPNFRQELTSLKIQFEEGGHTEERITDAGLVIKSPGISGKVPLIKKLRDKGIEIVSEIEFASRFTNSKIIAITGSNGKTTTTLLVHHILRASGLKAALGGNVGTSFARLVATGNYDWYVLEVSSFQLDDIIHFSPDIAIILNITPDHLDRYNYDFDQYIEAKFRIAKNLKADTKFIYFEEDPAIARGIAKLPAHVAKLPVTLKGSEPGAAWSDGLSISIPSKPGYLISIEKIPLRGKHNQVNVLAAMQAADAVGVEYNSILKGVFSFKNAPHRLEEVGTYQEITFINDSKATNVDSVYYALEAMKQPVIWIAGGVDKGNDYSQIQLLVKEKVKAIICLGKDNTPIKEYFKDIVLLIYETQDINECIEKCLEASLPGDVVLLSPACASFDLFQNYEDRGNKFRQAVQDLLKSSKNDG